MEKALELKKTHIVVYEEEWADGDVAFWVKPGLGRFVLTGKQCVSSSQAASHCFSGRGPS